ncbi:MAG: Gfo/Idh/MocA family protein [Limisphaerales bacterium]|jgi:predicted dehydrogenase|nr:Gfo/Idh/MocA family oxidoreductase [Verrucomicrobiota bacterium]
MKKIQCKNGLSRRDFLKASTVAATAFTIVPGHVLGLNGATPPSERVRIAGIGIGGQGAHDLGQFRNLPVDVVGLCDVDWARGAGSFNAFPKAKKYKDYRKMLDEMDKEIDAVIVATPDHTHAPASIDAMRRGKHVYCEKPLTHTMYEARWMAEEARKHGVATQMGNQGQASEDTYRLCEMIQAGAIGKVKELHVWTDRPSNGLFGEYWPQGVNRPEGSPPVPESLDWDLWLGVAPERPYHPAYHPFVWRGWWDFGTGALGDIGCHFYAPIFRALGLTGHYPKTVHAVSTRVNEETFPLGSVVEWQFESYGNNPPLKMVWYDGGLRPFRPDLVPEGAAMSENGRLIVGEEGVILDSAIYDEKRRKEVGEIPKTLERSPGHYAEFVLACKDPKKQPARMNFDEAGPLAQVVLMGNVALRVGLREELTRIRLHWDQEQFKFTNSEEANLHVHKKYRDGWTL